jgi:enamine deaminase RidA (YjgF/YER057c/UK114 family)
MSFEARLKELGIELPPAFDYPSSNRTGCVQAGHLLYSSGHPPPEDFGVVVRGKVGGDVSEEDAVAAARATSMNILASVRRQLGSLDRVKQVVKVTGMVNSAAGFERQWAVIDGASNFYVDVFGPEAGQHARSAIGMFELPRHYCMEIEAIFEVLP